MSKSQPDHYTRSGADALAKRITKFWHDRGFLGVLVNRYQDPDFPQLWFVRSNLVNGLPKFRR